MGVGELAVIHCEPAVSWQALRVKDFAAGLSSLGIEYTVTNSRHRISDGPAILFGTTFWRSIEDDKPWLLVDRASIGDPEYVSLGWNGHGRNGDHCVPAGHDSARWNALGVELQPLRHGGPVVVCGEADGRQPDVNGDYFRPHPSGSNPTQLPVTTDFIDGTYHVLRSSVAVDLIIRGHKTVVHDSSSMAYGVVNRESWAHWLAWTQWSWREIRSGAIGHLFNG